MSIIITRIRTLDVLELIAPRLILHDPAYQPLFLKELATWMVQQPDSIFVLGVFDKTEFKGFLIAQNPGPDIPHIVVAQAWCHPSNPREVADELFARTVLWASALNKISLRAETLRDEAMFRRFGFEPAERVVRYQIPETLDKLLVQNTKEVMQWAAHSSDQAQTT